MRETSSEISRRLAERAEGVCRRYLPNGKRIGDYWIAGDARGAKGRSLFVRLAGPPSGKGAAGKWQDAATGEHGDLLDLIAASCRFSDHRDALAEARRFLNDVAMRLSPTDRRDQHDAVKAAQRLFAASKSIAGSLAETYLKARSITDVSDLDALRFHPRCFYRHDRNSARENWPALIAAITDGAGNLTGVQRTFLARDGSGKAPLAAPRKAVGALAGGAVRFGDARDVLIVGEGIETVLSLRSVAPSIPLAAALSAQHLGMFRVPTAVKRLYIAVDRDNAGVRAADVLRRRAIDAGVDAKLLLPTRKDFNDDLRNAAAAMALLLDAEAFRALRRIR